MKENNIIDLNESLYNKMIQDFKDVDQMIQEAEEAEDEFAQSLPSNTQIPAIPGTKVTYNKEDMEPEVMDVMYNPLTGIRTPMGELVELEKDYTDDELFEKMMSEEVSISVDDLEKYVHGHDNKLFAGMSSEDIIILMKIMNDHINGKMEDHEYYETLPNSLKSAIVMQIRGGSNNKKLKNGLAKGLISELCFEYMANDSTNDLQNVMNMINEASEELNAGIANINASVSVMVTNDIVNKLKTKMTEAENNDDQETYERLNDLITSIEAATTLDEFKEFCKTVKIKKYDIERPDKIFNSFNNKYITHRLNINDIRTCPIIMSEHFKDHVEDYGVWRVCIAFCKYCKNMSPDVPTDHAFMYYFIKNIQLIDMIYPKGIIIETDEMEIQVKEFYDTFIINMNECINNIK